MKLAAMVSDSRTKLWDSSIDKKKKFRRIFLKFEGKYLAFFISYWKTKDTVLQPIECKRSAMNILIFKEILLEKLNFKDSKKRFSFKFESKYLALFNTCKIAKDTIGQHFKCTRNVRNFKDIS